MRRTVPHNKKWAYRLLACAMLLLALPARATWQCVTGSTCPQDCMQLHPAAVVPSPCVTEVVPRCKRCDKATSAVSVSVYQSSTAVACTTSQCVLRIQGKPEAALRDRLQQPFSLLMLPPPVAVAITSTVTVPGDCCTPPIASHSEQLHRPHLGRAPPVLL